MVLCSASTDFFIATCSKALLSFRPTDQTRGRARAHLATATTLLVLAVPALAWDLNRHLGTGAPKPLPVAPRTRPRYLLQWSMIRLPLREGRGSISNQMKPLYVDVAFVSVHTYHFHW